MQVVRSFDRGELVTSLGSVIHKPLRTDRVSQCSPSSKVLRLNPLQAVFGYRHVAAWVMRCMAGRQSMVYQVTPEKQPN